MHVTFAISYSATSQNPELSNANFSSVTTTEKYLARIGHETLMLKLTCISKYSAKLTHFYISGIKI
jgi:hypothetical protein